MTSSGAVSGQPKSEQRRDPKLPGMFWPHLIWGNQSPTPRSCACLSLLYPQFKGRWVVRHWKPKGPGEKEKMLEASAKGILQSRVVWITKNKEHNRRPITRDGAEQKDPCNIGRKRRETAYKATVVSLKGGFCFIFHLSKGVNLRKPYRSCGLLALKGKWIIEECDE